MILNSINQKIDTLKANPWYEDNISKNKIPDEYKLNYDVNNLFRVELSLYWRMIFTIFQGDNDDEVTIFIIDILDHEQYNKKFGYKKK